MGFSLASRSEQEENGQGNFFVRKSIEMIKVGREVGSFFVLENPLISASIAQANFQRHYGNSTIFWLSQMKGVFTVLSFNAISVPTSLDPREIIGNRKGLDQWVRHQGPPTFSEEGKYL